MTSTHRRAVSLSAPLTALAASAFAAGMLTGLGVYLSRSGVRDTFVPGSPAWPEHLGLAIAALAFAAATWWYRRRRRTDRAGLLVLAPIGKSAAARLSATLPGAAGQRAPLRALAALPPLLLTGYALWRAGEQVTAGLDPNFTVNAWGGPSYLGALACHYLDLALLLAAATWTLHLILPPLGARTWHPPSEPAGRLGADGRS